MEKWTRDEIRKENKRLRELHKDIESGKTKTPDSIELTLRDLK